MKHPHRSVIVEYKGRRGQKTKRPNALWGDLDLKAIAREVKQEAFQPDGEPADGQAPVPAAVEERPVAQPVPPAGHAETPIHDTAPASVAEKSAPSAETPKAGPKTKARPKRRKKAAAAEAPAILPAASSSAGDELEALETENAELKRLLIAKLRAENARLRRMLARVDRLTRNL